MNALPSAWLTRQQTQASDTMLDTCQVLAYSQTGTDAHNRPTYSYTAGDEIACGVKVASNRQASDVEGNAVLVDYVVRLPHGTAVNRLDRIRITGRYGVSSFTEVDCEIVGAVQVGPTAVVVNLKELVHG